MPHSPSATDLIRHLDLTSLGEDDRPEDILRLCARAAAAPCPPAALCVYPEHIGTARRELARLGLASVAVATVVNFPEGGADPARAARETRRALAAGGNEIDAVLPYRSLLAGDLDTFRRVADACREACGSALLKCILETGELADAARIAEASRIALAAGADFIKTSTGKVPVNATQEAAAIMLDAIAGCGRPAGFKAAGGIRTPEQAMAYREQVIAALGEDAATPARFRIGASGLLDALVAEAGGVATAGGSY